MAFITATTKVDKVQNIISSNTAPSNPTIGQHWTDTSKNPPVLFYWVGNEWQEVNMSIEKLDPITIATINQTIQNTIDDVNAGKTEIDEVLNSAKEEVDKVKEEIQQTTIQSQEALNKAEEAHDMALKNQSDLVISNNNISEAIEKAEFNSQEITTIKRQQSEDGQKLSYIEQNYNGLRETVQDNATKQESDRVQLAGMIADKVSSGDFESYKTQTASQISEVVQNQESSNQRLDTAEQSIQTIKGKTDSNTSAISQVQQKANQIAQSVSDLDKREQSSTVQLSNQISSKVDNEEYQSFKTQTAGQIASVVSNQQNMWRDSSFEALPLSDYTTTSSTTKISIVGNNEKDTQSQKEEQYGKEFQINNNTSKALRFDGRTDNNSYLYSKDTYSVAVGEVIEIGFDFCKNGSGVAVVGVRWFDKDGNLITGSNINSPVNGNGKWWHKNGKITVPQAFNIEQSDGSYVKKYPAKAQPYIAFYKTGASSDYCYFDNVKIIKQASSQTFQSQTVDSLVGRVSNNENQLSETIQTVNSINTTVQNKAEKSEVSQLANQITQKVENTDFESYKNQTAETISQALSSANGANNRLDTAEESIQQISKKTNDNTTLINQVKQTADSNTTTITNTVDKVSKVEQNLNGFKTTVANQQSNMQSQIDQQANKIGMIVDTDGDGQSNSYFVLNGDTVEMGAYNFLINSDVEVADDFSFSANNIKTGILKGSKPAWYTDGSVPNVPGALQWGQEGVPALVLFNPKFNGEKTNGLYMYDIDEPNKGLNGEVLYTNMSMFTESGIKFRQIYWSPNGDSETYPDIGYTRALEIKGFFDENNYSTTGLEIKTGGDTGMKLVGSDAFAQYNRDSIKKVVLGTDGADRTRSAIATSTIYAERIQSLDDTNNVGVRFDDRVNFTEYITGTSLGLSENLSVKGQITVDQITSSADGDNKGTTFNDRVNFTETITGTYGTFSGDITARKFITSSSKELKTDIKNFKMESAVNDILNVGVKEYIYEDEKEKIELYYENGQPIEAYSELPQEKHVGLIAEELLNYESLRPFIAIEKDAYGDETILGIDYGQLTPLLLAVCQKQQKDIVQMQDKIAKMEITLERNDLR